MKGVALASFLPLEFMPLLLMAAGFAVMFGAKKLAAGLAIVVLMAYFLPPIIGPIIDQIPLWALLAIGAFIVMGMFRQLITMLLGPEAWGILVTDTIKFCLRLVFIVPRSLLRFFLN